MEERIEPPDSPATAVRRAIADLEQCRRDQLGELASVVDVDELNAILDPPPGSGPGDVETITFEYCGYLVAVRSDGTLAIQP